MFFAKKRRTRSLWYLGLLLFCFLLQIQSVFWWWFVRSPGCAGSDCPKGDEPTILLPANGNIPLHSESSYVRSDISKIVHVPSESSIEIHLQHNSTRQCQNPKFMGRISGWSLSRIKFEGEHTGGIVLGKYDRSQIPVSGTYFVEIIVVLCEDYTRTRNVGDVYLKKECLQDTTMGNYRITKGNGDASIDIFLDNLHHQQSSAIRGAWLHKDFLAMKRDARKTKRDWEDKNNYPTLFQKNATKPLFTRYQPKECMVSEQKFKESKPTEFCQNLVDRTRFDSYTFRWKKGNDEILNKDVLQSISAIDIRDESRQHLHICFVGASHSRILNDKCQSLLKRTHAKGLIDGVSPLQCSFAEAKFPKEITIEWIFSHLGDCTHVVVGLFQWPFSFAQDQWNWSFSHWKKEMTTVTESLKRAARNKSLPLQRILLRSAHPNSFKWHICKCPPVDMRSAPNAKIASNILREIAESSPIVSFLDTDFIIDPVWDSPEDWSHYNLEEGSVEIKFILSEILRQQKNRTKTGPSS